MAGRQMGGHFATHSLNEDGSWKDLTKQKNSSSISLGQMPRLLDLHRHQKYTDKLKEYPIKQISQ
jgi:hypothetical protein